MKSSVSFEDDDSYLDDYDEDLYDEAFGEEEDIDEPYDDVEAEDGVIAYKNHYDEFDDDDGFEEAFDD